MRKMIQLQRNKNLPNIPKDIRQVEIPEEYDIMINGGFI